jgi:hypothetical protein
VAPAEREREHGDDTAVRQVKLALAASSGPLHVGHSDRWGGRVPLDDDGPRGHAPDSLAACRRPDGEQAERVADGQEVDDWDTCVTHLSNAKDRAGGAEAAFERLRWED